jgi:hypothetical protein
MRQSGRYSNPKEIAFNTQSFIMVVRELFKTDGISQFDDGDILRFLRAHQGRKDLAMSNISDTLVHAINKH